MTNEQIVMEQRLNLMKAGIIGGTGRTFQYKVLVDGVKEERTMEEPEEIHTYATWRALGYQVQKGEHAIAKFTIWKYTQKQDKETGEEKSNMFLKESAFFKASQVQAI